jgi:quercetin dioxygenase-like cupin family protein
MESRRNFLGLAVAALLPSRAGAQVPVPPAPAADQLGVMTRHALTGPLEGYEVVLTRSAMRFFPGSTTPVHRHPGVVLAYVLEGRVRFAINGEPERIVPAGGTFFEPLGAEHTTSGSASADDTTRILVFEVRPQVQA